MIQEYVYRENNPDHHLTNIKAMLSDIIDHVRYDLEEVKEPEAQTLFNTTAEVLQGLVTVYSNYQGKLAHLPPTPVRYHD